MICPLSPVSMLIFTSGPSWLCHTQTFQLAPLLYVFFQSLMLTFLLHTSNLHADYRSRLTIYAWHPQSSVSPASTNLKWKFWSSVELNSFLCFHFSPSLPHYGSEFFWFGPRCYLLPEAAQSFPIISPRPHSHYSTWPQCMGTVYTGGVSCLQGPSTNPKQEAPQSRPFFSSGHRNTKHLLMHGKCHHNQENPSV